LVHLGHLICKYFDLMAGVGDGDVTVTGVEQVRADSGAGVQQNVLGDEALGTMTRDRVTAVEVAMLLRVELDLTVAIETG
jgi:hypothetical protein